MLLSGYTAEQLIELKSRLHEVRDQSVPLKQLTPKEGVHSLDIIDILFRLELAPHHTVFATIGWCDLCTLHLIWKRSLLVRSCQFGMPSSR